ncbi:MAG TPA: CHAD domain-containing protein [Rhizomicrobium sp.]|jgi:inorganic triphosphatase YgiF|nr:CHAD domain-containing protein [Rhizomicrobium sp.]
MNTETELKLTAPARVLQALPRSPWLREMACGRTKRDKLVSRYFDTPDCKLQQKGVALRLRREAGKRIQTIKTGNGSAGALSRGEWDKEINGDRPDLGAAKGTPLERVLKNGAEKDIRAVFETHVERITIPLQTGQSDVELALDRGFIRAGKRRETLHEIELELKDGDPRDLAALAERFSDTWPVSYGALTKAERGYALRSGRRGQPVQAGDIRLDAAQSVGSAFSAIGLSCLHHLAGNQAAVRKGDPEGVHQMRVGLRRLRAAISVFKEITEGEKTEAIKNELKWLTEQLGPARDLDVLVEDALRPLHDEHPRNRDIEILKSDVQDQRKEGFTQAKAAVESPRYRKLVIDTALWLIAGPWSRKEYPPKQAALQKPIDAFTSGVLRKRTKKIVKKSRKAGELDARSRHKLRIAVKKLRYSTDFFASLFAKKKERKTRKDFEEILKGLQDSLGKLNDIAVHDRLAGQMVQLGRCTKKELQKVYAMGLLSGGEHKLAATCIADAKKTGKKLADAKPFW